MQAACKHRFGHFLLVAHRVPQALHVCVGVLNGKCPLRSVQVASPAMLETIKEQMIGLKKLCRIRTVRAIKQLHLNALGDLLSQLDSSRVALQGELNAMTVRQRVISMLRAT